MTKAVLVSLVAVMVVSSVSMARGGYGHGRGHGHGHGRGHGGGYNNGYNDGYRDGGYSSSSDDFGDGVLAGLLVSTSALFMSEVTADSHYAVYLNADQEAAEYLAVGGEPSPALKQAMNQERKFLAKAQVEGEFTEKEVAYLVMKRAESL